MSTKKPYFDGVTGSKSEELAALQEAAKQFRVGSFLYDFFTLELRQWLEATINDDVSPDLMHAYQYEKKLAQETGAALTQAQGKIQECVQSIADLAKLADERRKRIEKQNLELDRLNITLTRTEREFIDFQTLSDKQIESQRADIEKLKESAVEWQRQCNDIDWQRRQAEARNTILELDILKLKAEIYDLTKKLNQLTQPADQ